MPAWITPGKLWITALNLWITLWKLPLLGGTWYAKSSLDLHTQEHTREQDTMETMYAVFDGDYFFGLFPYLEDAATVAAEHSQIWGNTDMTVQEVSVRTFEFPVRKYTSN